VISWYGASARQTWRSKELRNFRDQRARTGPIMRTLEDQVRWTIDPEVPAYTAALILDEYLA
jgi:hypothetical protein